MTSRASLKVPRALVALLAIAVPLAGMGVLAPVASAQEGSLLVGFAGDTPPFAAIAAAGGSVVRVDPVLGFATVDTADVHATLAALAGAPNVVFVEEDATVVALSSLTTASTRWDSTRWDSTRWDSTRWDGAASESADGDSFRWDSFRWDSFRWDSFRWDAALCDSFRWDSSECDSFRWDSFRWDGTFEQDPLLVYQWGLRDLNVDGAWSYYQGLRGRTICVLDTGVDYTHPDLAPNMWTGPDGSHGHDFVNGDEDPMDDAGHGTHVAGVAAAAIGNGVGTAGVADERIMAVKVLNHRGVGGLGNLASGIRWCADHGANVISMSLGTTKDARAVERAVEYATSKGALLVASAGNAHACVDCASYPAAYPQVVAVTALTVGFAPASFSRATDYVELAAPGHLIAGPFLDGNYALGSGTSQATAFVAGLAALAWDVDHRMSADEVRAHLRASARDIGASGWDRETGHGIPDAEALLLRVYPLNP